MSAVSLHWNGPLAFRAVVESTEPAANAGILNGAGIYLWILTPPAGPTHASLSYVGKATGSPTLWARFRQHYQNQIGGLYSIPREFLPAGLSEDGEYWSFDWTHDAKRRLISDEDAFRTLVHAGFEASRAYEIYYASVDGPLAKIVERQLLWDLQPRGTTTGTKTPPDKPVRIRHEHAIWLRGAVRIQVKQGLKQHGRNLTDAGFGADGNSGSA